MWVLVRVEQSVSGDVHYFDCCLSDDKEKLQKFIDNSDEQKKWEIFEYVKLPSFEDWMKG